MTVCELMRELEKYPHDAIVCVDGDNKGDTFTVDSVAPGVLTTEGNKEVWLELRFTGGAE